MRHLRCWHPSSSCSTLVVLLIPDFHLNHTRFNMCLPAKKKNLYSTVEEETALPKYSKENCMQGYVEAGEKTATNHLRLKSNTTSSEHIMFNKTNIVVKAEETINGYFSTKPRSIKIVKWYIIKKNKLHYLQPSHRSNICLSIKNVNLPSSQVKFWFVYISLNSLIIWDHTQSRLRFSLITIFLESFFCPEKFII